MADNSKSQPLEAMGAAVGIESTRAKPRGRAPAELLERMGEDREELGLGGGLKAGGRRKRNELPEYTIDSDPFKAPHERIPAAWNDESAHLKASHEDERRGEKPLAQLGQPTSKRTSHTAYEHLQTERTRETEGVPSPVPWAPPQWSPQQESPWSNLNPPYSPHGLMHRTPASSQRWPILATPQPWEKSQYGLVASGATDQQSKTPRGQPGAALHLIATAGLPAPVAQPTVIVTDEEGLGKRFTAGTVNWDWTSAYDRIVRVISDALSYNVATHRIVSVENRMVIDSNEELREELIQAKDHYLVLRVQKRTQRSNPQAQSQMQGPSPNFGHASLVQTRGTRCAPSLADTVHEEIGLPVKNGGQAAPEQTSIVSKKREREPEKRGRGSRKRTELILRNSGDGETKLSDESDSGVKPHNRPRKLVRKRHSFEEEGDSEPLKDLLRRQLPKPRESGQTGNPSSKLVLKSNLLTRKTEKGERKPRKPPSMSGNTNETFPKPVPVIQYPTGNEAMATLLVDQAGGDREIDQETDAEIAPTDPDTVAGVNLAEIMSGLDVRSGLTPEFVKECCNAMVVWKGIPWSPSQRNVQVRGWRRGNLPTNLQVVSCFIMMSRQYDSVKALREASATDVARPIGVVCGHAPGLGKTAVAIWMFIIRLTIVAMWREVKKDRAVAGTLHLAADAPAGAICPSRERPGRPPLRCVCEPDSLTARLWAPEGLTVMVVPPALIHNWDAEFDKFVDREELERATGIQVNICLAHGSKSQREGRFPALDRLVTGPGNTIQSWVEANPDVEDVELVLALRDGTREEEFRKLRPPAVDVASEVTGTGTFVITTPQSMKSWVVRALETTFIPERRRQFACPSRDDCIKDPGKVCTSSTHLLTTRESFMPSLAFAEFGLDEAHMSDHNNSSRPVIESVMREQSQFFGFTPVCTPLTGTPHSKHPFEMMPYLLLHRSLAWDKHPEWKSITPEAVDKARITFEAMTEYASTKKTPSKKLQDELGLSLSHDTSISRKLKGLWERGPLGLARLTSCQFSIVCRPEYQWDGKPFYELPPFNHEVLPLDIGEYGLKVLGRYADKWIKLSKRFKGLEVADVNGKGRAGKAGAGGQEIKDVTRYIRFLCGIPYLDEILRGEIKNVHAGRVHDENWFDNFHCSPFAGHLDELIIHSPKLRYCIDRRLNALPDLPNPRRAVCETLDEQEQGLQNGRLVYMCFEPANAAILAAALKRRCPQNIVKVIRRQGSNKEDVKERETTIAGFQDTLVEGKWVTRVDTLVVCSKQGGTGLTLTGANEMIIFDVDPDIQRFEQVPKRIHRFGQKRSCRVVQLITRDLGLEGFTWERVRSRLHEAANAVPDLTLAMEALRSAGHSWKEPINLDPDDGVPGGSKLDRPPAVDDASKVGERANQGSGNADVGNDERGVEHYDDDIISVL